MNPSKTSAPLLPGLKVRRALPRAIIMVLSLQAMGAQGPPPPQPEAPQAAPGDKAREVNVHGRVVFEKETKLNRDEFENTLVWIETPALTAEQLRSLAAACDPAISNQKDMRFIPRVLPVCVGQTVQFPNNDTVFHSVLSRANAKKFDLGIYGPGDTKSLVFETPGEVPLRCAVHSEMEGFIIVLPTPFFTKPARDGAFRIDGVPAGETTLHVWHERISSGDVEATIKGDAAEGFTVTLSAVKE